MNHRRRHTWTLMALAALTLAAACGDDEDLDGLAAPDASVPAPDGATAPASVKFTDAALEGCVRAALNKPTGDLFPGDIANLRHLECQDHKVASLAGLEHATGLVDLSLFENMLTKIDALAGMTKLTSLQLGHNQIVDLSPLAKLTALTRLGLTANRVEKLAPLAGLKSLRWLNLDHNRFGDDQLTHLSKLKKLTWLTVEHNKIEDTSKVAPLISAGAEVYSEYREPDRSAALVTAAAAAPVEMVRRGRLVLRVGAGGVVTFAYATTAGERPLIPEYTGAVVLRGTELVHRTPAGDVAIGH